MKNWRIASIIVAALMLCSLAGSIAWAEQVTPPAAEETAKGELEVLKRMIQDVISENQELQIRVRELEEAMTKQQQAAEEAAKEAATEPTEEDEEAVKEKAEHYKLQEEEEAAKKATKPTEEDADDLASKISKNVWFGGAIEVEAFWEKDFDKKKESKMSLETAEIDFEVRAPHEWATGWLSLEWDTDDDKVTVDEAFVTIGNTGKYPLYLVAGRLVVPFGVGTGETVSDTPLSITDPLTIEVFETKEDVGLLGFTSGGFEAGVYAFSGSQDDIRQFGAAVAYSVLNDNWALNTGFNLISNVFDSDELSNAFPKPKSDYNHGIAAHAQFLISDFSIVLEYNGAIDRAVLEEEEDGEVTRINVRPEAWQIELGYFTEILDKDTFFALGYSQSDNLGGEFAEKRFLGTIGMWIFDDLRLKIEYDHDWDYSKSQGGTAAESDKVTSQLTFEW